MKDLTYVQTLPWSDQLVLEIELPEVSHDSAVPDETSSDCSETVTSFHSLSSKNSSPHHLSAIKSVSSVTEKRGLATNNCSRATLVSLADFVYSRVIARSIKTFWPNQQKNPKYVLAYVEETLECGHVVDIHPSDIEKLVARKRQCHECQKFFGGLDLKKPANGAKAAQRSRATGKVNWPAVGFAFVASVLVASFAYLHRPKDLLYCYNCTPSTRVRILEQFNDFDFQIQRVVDGVPQEPEVHRFHEKLPLEAGFTLKKLQVEDKGDYWTTAPFQLPYIIERYPGTVMPTLPDNCHQDPANPIYGRVSCSGRPNFKY